MICIRCPTMNIVFSFTQPNLKLVKLKAVFDACGCSATWSTPY